MGTSEPFFEESQEQSEIKSMIIAKYFLAWARVIKGTAKKQGNNIAYIDLFAGPGRFGDGAISTPLLVLERALEDPDLCRMLVTIFNDVDSDHSRTLEKEIAALPNIDKLCHKPVVKNEEVGEDIVKMFEELDLVPTFFFVDPWGYKGLSLRLINSVLKNWGCDCVFFFNYNRINMGLSNPLIKSHIDALFGEERANELRAEIDLLSPGFREQTIIEAICDALQAMGGKFTLPFTFRRANGSRTSHHLIFVSKHVKGYNIMKEIMAKESTIHEQGVPTFEYNPALQNQGLLFDLSRPLDDLDEMLLSEFSGQTMSMAEIFDNHHVGLRYVKPNYKEVLLRLESNGKIKTEPSFSERRPNTFADHVLVTFP